MLKTDYVENIPVDGGVIKLDKLDVIVLPQESTDTVHPAGIPVEFVLAQNEHYMDIGSSKMDHDMRNIALPFLLTCAMACCMFLSVMGLETFTFIFMSVFMGIASFVLFSVLGYCVIRRRYSYSTIRFDRKNQHILFKRKAKSTPHVIKWQDVIVYLKPELLRGENMTMDLWSINLAWYNKETQELNTFYKTEGRPMEFMAVDEWRFIQRYMNGDDDNYNTARYKLVPCSETFKIKREKVWQAFINNENKRLFAFDMRDMSVSYFSISIYYLMHILQFWRIPYLFCDLYLALAIKPYLFENKG